jgi:hypothetical protein
MLIHLPIIFLTSLHPIAVANTVPKFDISLECQSEGGTKAMLDRCADDEKQALKQLRAEWPQFVASDVRQCTEETNIDGSPSYVELLTCLEMARDVRAK